MVSTKILSSSTVFNIDNKNSWEPNQYIRMISEGSSDTEIENIEIFILNCNNI